MRFFLRFAVGVLFFTLGMGLPAIAGSVSSGHNSKHLKPHHGIARKVQPEPVITDSTSDLAWRKKLPWLYRDSALSVYRESVLRPLFKEYGLGPGRLSRHGEFVEAVFPRGKPLHEYAYEVEALCGPARIHVLQGEEFDPPEEKVEYRLQVDSAAPFALRLSLGKDILPGSTRMALVIVSLDSVNDSAARQLLALPFSLTLAIAAGDSAPVPARWMRLPPDKEALLELPMEPSNYPYVKPGPGALFIHYSRSEVEGLLKAKLKSYPAARGFATTFGDRAIENRPLLENAMEFMAERSLIFLDLTGSPRSLSASIALQTSGIVYTAHIQEPDLGDKFEAELLHRCDLAVKTGEGIWVLRYFPGLPNLLESLLNKNRDHFQELGLEWSTLSALRDSFSVATGNTAGNPGGLTGAGAK